MIKIKTRYLLFLTIIFPLFQKSFAEYKLSLPCQYYGTMDLLNNKKNRDVYIEKQKLKEKKFHKRFKETIDGYTYRYYIKNDSAIIDASTNQYAVASARPPIVISPEPKETLFIPEKLGGFPVTKISSSVFWKCSRLKHITIPDTVIDFPSNVLENTVWYSDQPNGPIYIGKNFYKYKGKCPEIFELKKDTKNITDFAFRECTFLKEIKISNKSESFIIENGLLYNKNKTILIMCPQQKDGDIIIPNTVKIIQSGAFKNCEKINSVIIGDNVEIIEQKSFSNCINMKEVKIGGNVEQINRLAFNNCARLTSIIIPANVKNIRSAFQDCLNLSSIEVMGNAKFFDDDIINYLNLNSIKISNTNSYYSSLDNVLYNKSKSYLIYYPKTKKGHFIIPNGVTEIKYCAFFKSKLSAITIPNSVVDIKNLNFKDCQNLRSIYWQGDCPSNISPDIFKSCKELKNYINSDSKGWSDMFGGRKVIILNEKKICNLEPKK